MFKKLLPIIFSFALLQPCYADNLPELGDPSLASISQHDIDSLSKELMTKLQRSGVVLNDIIVTDYIKRIGDRLIHNSNMHKRIINFFVIKSSVLNAFAGPGGNIAVNTGLILAARNESELAAVMAHELAHVQQYHILRLLVKQKQMKLPLIAGVLASIAIGMSNPQAGNAAMMSSMAALQQSFITFTRGNESEADNIGMRTLAKSGFNPHAMASMFQLLQNQSRFYSTKLPEILLTHPVTSNRIADAESRADKLKIPHARSNEEFHLIQAKLRVETSKNNFVALNYFKKALDKHPDEASFNYGYALALAKSQQYKHSNMLLLNLMEKHPDQILLSTALANNYLDQNQNAKAETLLKQALANNSKSYPLQLEYAMCLIHSGDAKQAASMLLNLVVDHRDDANLYSLLAQAQARAGSPAEAYFSRAQAFQIHGDVKKSIHQLLTAQKLNKNNKYLKAMIDAKLAELNYKPSK